MDGGRFDDLARGFASSTSRRGLLKAALGGLVAGLAGLRPTSAAACRGATDICRKDGDCCSKLCGPTDSTGRRRCICPPGQEPCNRTCVDPTVAYQSDPKNCGSCGVACPRPSDPCLMAICTQGVCGSGPDPAKVGRACSDGDLCTVNDVCQPDGSCQGTPKTCTTNVVCQVAFCDPVTGDCAVAPAADGASCNADNSACTVDTCQSGSCVAGAPKDCSTDPAVNDACNTGVCDPASGQCVKQPKENGTACNADDSLCTENDTCQAGVCTPGTAKTCPASLNQCQINGTCDPTTGECVYEFAPATTACDDDNPFCFQGFCCASPCTVYTDPLDPATAETICCPSGQTCQTIDVEIEDEPYTVGICCDSGADACFDFTTITTTPSLVCCPGGTSCKPLEFGETLPIPVPVGACCAGDACITLNTGDLSNPLSIVCCEGDEACTAIDLSALPNTGTIPFTPGVCCAAGVEACLNIDITSGLSIDAVCCAAGETCQTTTVSSLPLSTCCATEACPTFSLIGSTPSLAYECCAGGTTCSTLEFSGQTVGLCCPEGQQVVVEFGSSGSTPTFTCAEPCGTETCTTVTLGSGNTPTFDQICCPSGTLCAPVSFGGGSEIPGVGEIGACCAEGVVACVTSFSAAGAAIGCCEGTCHTLSTGFDFCCPAGTSPVFSGQAVTCVSDTACPVFTDGTLTPVDCPDGTECLSISSNGFEVGACCAAGEVLAVDEDTVSTFCCPAAQACAPAGSPVAICCEVGDICSNGACQPQT